MATVTTRLGPADAGRTLTLDEFITADFEEGYRYELARGVLEVTHVPNEPHGLLVWWLLCAIGQYHRDHPGLIRRAGGASEFRLFLPVMESGRNPDLAVVLRQTPRNPRGQRPPVLAMEVVSPGSDARERDYVTKRQEYLAYGLLEYWIIDPLDRRVTVLIRDGDAWTERVFTDDQSAEGLVLPGFSVRLTDLWAAVAPDEEGGEETQG